MKRLIFILCIVAILFSISGCDRTTPVVSPDISPDVSEETPIKTFYSPSKHGANYFDIDVKLEQDANPMGAYNYGDLFLFYYECSLPPEKITPDSDSSAYKLLLLDLDAGTVAGKASLPSYATNVGFFPDGSIYAVHNDSGLNYTVYDETLSVAEEHLIFENSEYYSVTPGTNGFWVYCDTTKEEILHVPYHSSTYQSVPVGDLRENDFLIIKGETETGLIVICDGEFYELNTVSGEHSSASYLDEFYLDGYFAAATDRGLTMLFDIRKPETTYFLHTESDSESMIAHSDKYFATTTYSETQGVSIYNLSGDSCYRSLPISDDNSGGYLYCNIFDSKYAVITLYDYSGFPKFYRWDFAADTPETVDIDIVATDDLPEANAALSSEIEEKYGVGIYYGEAGTSFEYEYSDYSAIPVESEFKTHFTLQILSDFMAKFPTEMFGEMCTESTRYLNIYLCGTLSPLNDSSIASAAALAMTNFDASSRIVAIDISQFAIQTNFAHEFLHVMEDRLSEYNYSGGIDYLQYWHDLTPDDFEYHYDYHDDEGNEITQAEYTAEGMFYETDYSNVWFIDAYSTTLPTEDRARIFEGMFSYELPISFQSEHIVDKALYLGALIRGAFPSCAAVPLGELWWERNIDAKTLDDYAELVSEYVIIY